jgi:hypothetical protein
MGTYGLEGVLLAWKTGKLTTEQAVGQILQLLQELERRVTKLEQLISPPPSTLPSTKIRRRKRTGRT